MLISFAFDRLALAASDIFFQHPNPPEGQEGPEHGVRIELRFAEKGELRGSVYSARPVALGVPIWRIDILGSFGTSSQSLDRTHHHPRFVGWDESIRFFDEHLSADPLSWLRDELSSLDRVLERAGVSADVATAADAEELRLAVPKVLSCVEWLLAEVRDGRLGRAPAHGRAGLIRSSWL